MGGDVRGGEHEEVWGSMEGSGKDGGQEERGFFFCEVRLQPGYREIFDSCELKENVRL